MLKLLGLIFLVAASSLAGYFRGEEKRKAYLFLREMLRFFRHVHFEIETFMRTQEEIYQRFSSAFLERCGFLPLLREEVKKDPAGALDRCLKEITPTVSLSPLFTEPIYAYSENFGYRSRETELGECAKLILWLEMTEREEKIKTEQAVRLCRTVGITAGIGILIILL